MCRQCWRNSNLGPSSLETRVIFSDHRHDQGWHGRPGFTFQQPAAGSAVAGLSTTTTTTAAPKKRTKRFLGKKTTTTPPPVRPIASQANVLTSLTTPPFLHESIEAVVDGIEACKPYIFTLKIYSPRNAVMGEIEGYKTLSEDRA